MAQFDLKKHALVGPGGSLEVPAGTRSPRSWRCSSKASAKAGPPTSREEVQLQQATLFPTPRWGPRKGGDRIAESETWPQNQLPSDTQLVRQVIRHRLLDPDASPEVIAQKLVQSGWTISIRSVERVLADYTLQKKLHRAVPSPCRRKSRRGSARRWSDPWTGIRSASNAAFVSDWRTRSWTIWLAYGCSSRSTSAGDLGPVAEVDATARNAWSRDWRCNWSMKRPYAVTGCARDVA